MDMADCCEGSIDTAKLEANQRRVLVIVMIINLVTFAGMVVASWLSHSSALLSGTLDNLGDALTYAMSLAVVGASVAAKARVALFKGLLISAAAIAVAVQIGWRLTHMEVPVVSTMGIAAVLNLCANFICLTLLTPHRHDDVNMSSVWECSRNDVAEGLAVIATVVAVWLTDSAWPDLIVATALLIMFSRSAFRVLGNAWSELRVTHAPAG
jgi:Co/Zn/Cd efflux system component